MLMLCWNFACHRNPHQPKVLLSSWTHTDRIKEVIQRQFGKSDRKTILSSETQLMPKPKDWHAFLYNGENMMELIRFLALYYKAEKFGHKLEMPLIFTGLLRSMILVQWR